VSGTVLQPGTPVRFIASDTSADVLSGLRSGDIAYIFYGDETGYGIVKNGISTPWQATNLPRDFRVLPQTEWTPVIAEGASAVAQRASDLKLRGAFQYISDYEQPGETTRNDSLIVHAVREAKTLHDLAWSWRNIAAQLRAHRAPHSLDIGGVRLPG
jgi:hypothetical protein